MAKISVLYATQYPSFFFAVDVYDGWCGWGYGLGGGKERKSICRKCKLGHNGRSLAIDVSTTTTNPMPKNPFIRVANLPSPSHCLPDVSSSYVDRPSLNDAYAYNLQRNDSQIDFYRHTEYNYLLDKRLKYTHIPTVN